MRRIDFSFISLFCGLILLLGAISEAKAARPLNTDDPGVVSVADLELETAYEYVDGSDKENNLSTVFTVGLLSGIDIGVELPYQFIDVADGEDQNGLSDIGITTKWNFYDNEDDFSTALTFTYKSDNGEDERGLGTGEPEYTILGVF
jgi:hypothetical protein